MSIAPETLRDRWERIENLFHAALQQPEDARARYIAEASKGDAELKAEVERLLASYAASDDFIEPPAEALLSGTPTSTSDVSVKGRRIGQYQLIRVIASGGMGTVYEALQDEPRRSVAIKVMRAGPQPGRTLRRFRYEAAILGRLRHHGIAQVFEAGTHVEDGQSIPYFAMEYIPDACSITDYAQTHGLDVRKRLEMFAEVCDAVHHGHQKGVIHRDIKPANILVDPAGSPKVIDFGIARVLDPDVATTTVQTGVGQLIGTLSYLSPEQCSSQSPEVDTRSDVYALGVVLYELLCERLPYDLQNKAITEVATVIMDTPPTRPSSINHLLRGDLETITLKALAKDREARYQSASELAADIRNFLNDEPIRARPPSRAYQIRMFVRRNRAFVTAGVVATIGLIAAAGISTTFWIREAEQRERAERVAQLETAQRAKAETIKSYLAELLSSANPEFAKGRDVTVREVLDRVAPRLTADLGAQPDVEMEMQTLVGNAYLELGIYEDSEAHFRRALVLCDDLDGQTLKCTEAMVGLGNVLAVRNEFEKAEPYLRQAIALREQILGDEHPEVAVALDGLADMQWKAGHREEAEQLADRALSIFKQYPKDDTGQAANCLALVYSETDRMERAEAMYAVALEKARLHYGEDHQIVASYLNNRASLSFERGQLDLAAQSFTEALAIYRRLLGDDHLLVAAARNNLGVVFRNQGDLQRAEQMYREALAGYRKSVGEQHTVVATCLNNIGTVLLDQGKAGEALMLLKQALDLQVKLLSREHPDVAITLTNIARAHYARGELDEAESHCWQGLGILRRGFPVNSNNFAHALSQLGAIQSARSDDIGAEASYREALNIWRKLHPDGSRHVVQSKIQLGRTLVRLGRYEEAEVLLADAYSAAENQLRNRPKLARQAAESLAAVYRKLGRTDDAKRFQLLAQPAPGTEAATDNSDRE